MERESVQSSNLKSVGYDPLSHILEIEFHSGGLYQYSVVPESVHRELMMAGSKGSYFDRNIKNRFPYHKLG
jgi:hypothetical protein